MTTTFIPAFDINPTGTTAALGRKLRLRRLFGADGRTVTVALDQAVPRGVAPRLATIGTTFASIAEGDRTPSPSPRVWPARYSAATARHCRGS